MPSVQLSGDVVKTLRDVKGALVAVAASLREQRLSDPRPFVMLRSAIWMDLERLPPNKDGVTQIPEPSLDRRRQFEQLQNQGDWGNLILEVEKTLGAGVYFWLDAQRLVANALEALGPGYRDARRAVVESLGFLLRRLPGLERLKFGQVTGAAGIGFADDLTLSWIASEVVPAAASHCAGSSAADAPWVEVANQAAALAVKGKLQEGLALFREGVQAAGSGRERFYWELGQARACAEAGLHRAAIPQLEHLESLVVQHQLELWDPALAVEVAQLYLTAHAKANAGPGRAASEATELYSRMLARLCRYDVTAALTIPNE